MYCREKNEMHCTDIVKNGNLIAGKDLSYCFCTLKRSVDMLKHEFWHEIVEKHIFTLELRKALRIKKKGKCFCKGGCGIAL